MLKLINVSCIQDYELVPKKGQCCGECVKKRCSFNNETYNIGDMWKSEDQCTFYECAESRSGDGIVSAQITSYQKSCPPINNCPANRVLMRDCCPYCGLETKQQANSSLSDFIHAPDKYNKIFSRDTYLTHPCRRTCVKGEPPKECRYTFVVCFMNYSSSKILNLILLFTQMEWYETLSKACYECPFNTTDCYRPHCITGDGFRRSILVVNRMMPGPPIEVCLHDTLIVDVENKLMGESTIIHWHGLHQRDSKQFDIYLY